MGWARAEPRNAAIVCKAALDRGDAVRGDIERLAATDGIRFIRRTHSDEPDPAFCLRPDLVARASALADDGLYFGLCPKEPKLPATIGLVDACPNVPIVLDHIAKRGSGAGLVLPRADRLLELARRESLVRELSGMAAGAAADRTPATLRPYMGAALEASGAARNLLGGPGRWRRWPMAVGTGWRWWTR